MGAGAGEVTDSFAKRVTPTMRRYTAGSELLSQQRTNTSVGDRWGKR